MFSFTKENMSQLILQNIHITELKPRPVMSQPRKLIQMPRIRMLARGGRLPSNIRITNIRGIRPPTPAPPTDVKKKDDNNIRAQLQKEIAARARTCAYKNYECWTPVVSGRRYCGKHLLSDPTAPYIPCGHTYPSGETCGMPAPVGEKTPGLCLEHARAALLSRQRSAAPPPPVISTETLLNHLQHYVKAERPRTTSCASSISVVSDPEPEQDSTPIDPFKHIQCTTINASYSTSLLECCSASESDEDNVTLGPDSTCRFMSMDVNVEDVPTEDRPLWHAGVFTAEEAISETKSCLESLQQAYLRQAQRCNVLLKMARKDYLKSLKLEKEQYCSINSQARSGPLNVRERRQLRKLKAFASYHKKHGVDAVLARKLHRKRTKAETGREKPIPAALRCVFSEGGVRCAVPSLPAAKHCIKHVLLDHNQVLYRACGDMRGMSACQEPVSLSHSHTCRYHADVPTYTHFSLKKDESASDSETDTGTDASFLNEHEAM